MKKILSENFATPTGIKVSELDIFISSYVEKFINKRVSGIQISVTKNDAIVFSKGYGLGD